MAYAFKLTTKQPIAGGKIPKGVSFSTLNKVPLLLKWAMW